MGDSHIVSPEAARIAEYATRHREDADGLLIHDFAYTVGTEDERIRAAMAQAYAEGEAAAWNRHLPEWTRKPNPYK